MGTKLARPEGFGAPHRHYRATDSTNSRARELAAADAPHGTVVTAGRQSAGRGRQGRTWSAPADRALLYSAILRPLDERHLLLPLAAPIAVAAAAEELNPQAACRIKWPNDVWLEERKLAGILIEARPQDGWAVIGVGLNLTIERGEFPAELRDTAISLDGAGNGAGLDLGVGAPGAGLDLGVGAGPGAPAEVREAARRALDAALGRWVCAGADEVLAAWRGRDALEGREIGWENRATGEQLTGVADGVDERGNLLVVVAGGDRVALGAGEVHLRL